MSDGITDRGQIRWTFGAGGAVRSSPTVVDGTVFVGTNDSHVYAIDAATGQQQWRFETNGRIRTAPQWVNGTLFVSGYDRIYAIGSRNGAKRWRARISDGSWSSPTAYDGKVFLGTKDGQVVAFSEATGTKSWERDIGSRVRCSPTVCDGSLVIGGFDHDVYVLDADTGALSHTIATDGAVESSPTVSDGTIFVGSNDEQLQAYALQSGETTWAVKTGRKVASSPTVADELVLCGSHDGSVYALDIDTGSIVWKFDTKSSESSSSARRRPVWSSPTVAGETVLVGGMDGTLYALSLHSGERSWTVETGDSIQSSPTVVDGTAFVGSDDGSVYAVALDRSVSSRDSRVLLGTLGHHGRRRTSGRPETTGRRQSPDSSPQHRRRDVDTATTNVGSDGTGQRPAVNDSRAEGTSTEAEIAVAYEQIERVEQLGRGGNADVYYATVRAGDEEADIALKEPRMSGTLHTEIVEQMMEEAETWQQLDDHSYIVSVLDYGTEPLPWIAMEYMDRGHLGERTDTMSLAQKLWTAIAVTKGVRHAHRRGVAHLDLKPENVLFRTGEHGWDVPKVADWGLSKHLLKHSKSIEGLSPHYAAPEQFDDSYGSADDLTDVYQLGAVFYELFTGRPPFEGQPAMVMNRVLNEQPDPPSAVADVPPELDDVLQPALAREKADRYESVLYFRDELQALQESL